MPPACGLPAPLHGAWRRWASYLSSFRCCDRQEQTKMKQLWRWTVAAIAIALSAHPTHAQDKPEISKLRLAVGGKSAIFYLPLSVTERLGYFRDAGLEVEIADVQSGARALQSL